MTVWASVRAAVSSTTDAFGRFLLANAVWLLVAGAVAVAGAFFRPAYVLALALVPITCGLLGMAAHTVRKDFPNLRHFREGVGRRPLAHMALGGAEMALLAAAVVNIGIGMSGASLLAALITVVSGYVALVTVIVAVASWPLLIDPRRSRRSMGAVLRLAGALIAARPVRIVLVALIEGLLAIVVTQTPLLALFLPSFGALVAAHFVLPAADDLERRRRAGTPIRRSAPPV